MIFQRIKGKARVMAQELKWRLFSAKPTVQEVERLDILKKRINGLPPLVSDGTNTLDPWIKNRARLRSDIMRCDARNFLRWTVVNYTMFTVCKKVELDELMKSKKWSIWEKVLPETGIGNPRPYEHYEKSSGNLIHAAYHLDRFFGNSQLPFGDMNAIVEFGGGYGCMARLISNLGFGGTYIIFDLPEFCALQEYYLSSAGFKVFTEPTREKGVVVLSSLQDFKKQCSLIPALDMFIATWSLSESPLELRKSILEALPPCPRILITYQEKFDGIDNIKYFGKDARTDRDLVWEDTPIVQMPGSHYLLGKARRPV